MKQSAGRRPADRGISLLPVCSVIMKAPFLHREPLLPCITACCKGKRQAGWRLVTHLNSGLSGSACASISCVLERFGNDATPPGKMDARRRRDKSSFALRI